MSEQIREKSDTHFLYKIINTLQNKQNISEVFKFILGDLKDSLGYKVLEIRLFDSDNNFQVISKGSTEKYKNKVLQEADFEFLKNNFQSSTLKFFNSSEAEFLSDLLDLQIKPQKIAIFPLITNKHLIGIIAFSAEKLSNENHDEIILIDAIGSTISYTITNLLAKKEFHKINQELREAASSIRHDFANDMQSIEMTIELLLTTEITDDQNKYMKLLCNAKDSAVKRLKEFIELKTKFERSANLNVGIKLS